MAILRIVVHDFARQLFDQLLADHAILAAGFQVAGYDAGGSAPRKSSPTHCSGRSAAAHATVSPSAAHLDIPIKQLSPNTLGQIDGGKSARRGFLPFLRETTPGLSSMGGGSN